MMATTEPLARAPPPPPRASRLSIPGPPSIQSDRNPTWPLAHRAPPGRHPPAIASQVGLTAASHSVAHLLRIVLVLFSPPVLCSPTSALDGCGFRLRPCAVFCRPSPQIRTERSPVPVKFALQRRIFFSPSEIRFVHASGHERDGWVAAGPRHQPSLRFSLIYVRTARRQSVGRGFSPRAASLSSSCTSTLPALRTVCSKEASQRYQLQNDGDGSSL